MTEPIHHHWIPQYLEPVDEMVDMTEEEVAAAVKNWRDKRGSQGGVSGVEPKTPDEDQNASDGEIQSQ